MKRLSFLRIFLALLLPGFFLLSACDSGGSNEEEEEFNNEFSFTVTPASSSDTEAAATKISQREINGFSFFVDSADFEEADEQVFVVYFSGSDSFSQQNATEGLFGFVARQSNRPSTGQYAFSQGSDGELSASDFMGLLYEDMQNVGEGEVSPFYVLQSGSVSFTESRDSKVAGSISAMATAYSYSDSGLTEEQVEISGEFTAENLDSFVPFDQYDQSPTP